MRTATIEQVLGPVAEMVSEMLLALDNPNAIIQLTDEFHHNVTIVTDSVNNLVKVVQDMVNTSKVRRARSGGLRVCRYWPLLTSGCGPGAAGGRSGTGRAAARRHAQGGRRREELGRGALGGRRSAADAGRRPAGAAGRAAEPHQRRQECAPAPDRMTQGRQRRRLT